jgi:hypothetical protein
LVAQVAYPTRAHAALEPTPAHPAGLADPSFIQEPDLEPPGLGMIARDSGNQAREVFLNAAWA